MPKEIIWFWPVNDRAKVHARLGYPNSHLSLCKMWIQQLGEDIEPITPDDDRPVCKACLKQVGKLGA